MTHTPIEITAELVRELLNEQHPDLADRPVRLGARGWDNRLWRLGDELAVRLPWVTESADVLLHNEHTWLPALAPHLPLPIPVPQRLGHASERFPRPWIVTTWVRGEPADRAPATDAESSADAPAAFLTALHRPAPAGAPVSRSHRGGPPADHSAGFTGQLDAATAMGLIPDPDAVRAVWKDAVAAPEWAGPPLWPHADLHPANVGTAHGTFSGVIDFGDLCPGDPAYDLSGAWLLLPDGAADRFFAAYEPTPDAATLRRARGWAAAKAIAGLLIGEAGVQGRPGGKPTWGPPGRATPARLVARPTSPPS
ncbi:aminoglycoside phosphotransferase family protein [Streptomyces caeruleatus]|uniref:Aminoglycoside phosphotransferase n=1 Tax=Streptomyces caeruleatus TaxID=661399 RepID=A0A101U345_9ACTN|nr:aminoglycoside phosphotransferase family protein [Streptomyces caeruleatus]KUO03099.1 aminoglycoside phosphotransferase [Streptomyces caeruleatus]